MLTLTTTQLRENLSDVFNQVVAGQDVILVMGRGKRAKKIKLTRLSTPSSTSTLKNKILKNHPHMQAFLESKEFQNFEPPAEIQQVKDPTNFLMKDYFKLNV